MVFGVVVRFDRGGLEVASAVDFCAVRFFELDSVFVLFAVSDFEVVFDLEVFFTF